MEGFIFDLLDVFNLPTKELISLVDSVEKESKNMGAKKLNKDTFLDARRNIIGKEIKKAISSITGSRITLTNNEIKYIIKVIKYLESRGVLLKGTTTKVTSQEGGFFNFLRPLMAAGLPLIKSVLTPLAKIVLIL